MEVATCTTTVLKPANATPHPLAGEKVPLTIFDRAARGGSTWGARRD